MARGHKTGGRRPGSLNKANSSLLELVEQEAGGPLPVILARIGREALESKDLALAVQAFARSAAYVYARVQPMPHPGDVGPIPPLFVLDGVAKVPEDWPGAAVRISSPGDNPKNNNGPLLP